MGDGDIKQNLLYKQLSKYTKLDFDLQIYLRAEQTQGPEFSLKYLENAMEMSLERDREFKRAQEISAAVASGGKQRSASVAKAKAKSKTKAETEPRKATEATAWATVNGMGSGWLTGSSVPHGFTAFQARGMLPRR